MTVDDKSRETVIEILKKYEWEECIAITPKTFEIILSYKERKIDGQCIHDWHEYNTHGMYGQWYQCSKCLKHIPAGDLR